MNEKAKTLAELMIERPELKVVAKVDEDIVADEGFSWWLGEVGDSQVDHLYNDGEKVWFKSDDVEELETRAFDRIYDSIEEMFGEGDINNLTVSQMAEKEVRNYDWKEVIVVIITVSY